jgi:acyl dehydratase
LAHGFQILCCTAAGASNFALAIGDSLIAFVEQSSKFLKPVYPGDTLYPVLEIAALTPQRSTGSSRWPPQCTTKRVSWSQKILLRKRGPELSGAR